MRDVIINGIKFGTTDDLKEYLRNHIDDIEECNVLYYARRLGVMEKYKCAMVNKHG